MDRVILGDNQFFGINHMSEEKAMTQARRFQDDHAIIDVLDAAYDAGIHAFTFSTHDRVQVLCDHFRAHPDRYADLRLYPAMPYAHKYAHAVANKGIIGTLKEVVFKDRTAEQALGFIARGGSALFTQDAIQIMKLLVDTEMKMFRDLNVKVVLLQNIVTDLLLGLGFTDIFLRFVEHIEEKYHVRAGFITLNMPRLVDALLARGMENPVVCAAINKVGFQMHPDLPSYETTLRRDRFEAMAMSILAAGAVKPAEAVEYIARFETIKSVIFGASTPQHIRQTKGLIESAHQTAQARSKESGASQQPIEYAS